MRASPKSLDSKQVIENYLLAKCAAGDPSDLTYALRILARAADFVRLSRRLDIPSTSCLLTLSDDNPTGLLTASKIADALGFRLQLVRKS